MEPIKAEEGEQEKKGGDGTTGDEMEQIMLCIYMNISQ